ncbi:erythromycin esterase family protein [Yinghuangia aomiensis]
MLRDHYGSQYTSVAIGFHHGDLGPVTVPEPASDWLDARLGTTDQPAHWLDLRGSEWDGPTKARVISGVSTTRRRTRPNTSPVASLPDAFGHGRPPAPGVPRARVDDVAARRLTPCR